MSKWVSVSNNLTDGVETAIVGYEHRFDEDGVTIAIITHKTKEVEYKDEAAKLACRPSCRGTSS